MQQMEHASSGAGAPLSAAAEPAVAFSTCAGALVGAGEPAVDGVCDTGARDGDGDGDTDSAIADGDSAVPLPGLVADTDGDDDGRADGEAVTDGVGVTDKPVVGDTDADVDGDAGDALTDTDRATDGLCDGVRDRDAAADEVGDNDAAVDGVNDGDGQLGALAATDQPAGGGLEPPCGESQYGAMPAAADGETHTHDAAMQPPQPAAVLEAHADCNAPPMHDALFGADADVWNAQPNCEGAHEQLLPNRHDDGPASAITLPLDIAGAAGVLHHVNDALVLRQSKHVLALRRKRRGRGKRAVAAKRRETLPRWRSSASLLTTRASAPANAACLRAPRRQRRQEQDQLQRYAACADERWRAAHLAARRRQEQSTETAMGKDARERSSEIKGRSTKDARLHARHFAQQKEGKDTR